MALACAPDLLVLDEPTTGLDVTTQEQIIELLADLRARLGMSMLYVTHDLGVLAEIADRVGVMYAGHLVEIAPTAVLFSEPRHPYTRGLNASIPRLDAAPRAVGNPCAACCVGTRSRRLPLLSALRLRRAIVRHQRAAERRDRPQACRRLPAMGRDWPAGAGRRAGRSRPTAPDCPGALLELEDISLSYGGRSPWRRMFGQGPGCVVRACPSRSSAARRSRWSASRQRCRRSRARSAAYSRQYTGRSASQAGRCRTRCGRARTRCGNRFSTFSKTRMLRSTRAARSATPSVGRSRSFPDAPAQAQGADRGAA